MYKQITEVLFWQQPYTMGKGKGGIVEDGMLTSVSVGGFPGEDTCREFEG